MANKSSSEKQYDKVPRPTAKIDPNNIIVRLQGWSDIGKKNLREHYNVTNFKTCSCGDKDLELWGLDTIELSAKAVSELRNNRSEGDHNFFFPFPKPLSFKPLDCYFSKDNCVSGDNDPCVNIVVIDSGVNTNYFNDDPFLYDTSGLGGCVGNFGWNFIDGSSDVFDNHGHGTYVTKIITDMLKAKGIGYRILPLKVLDSEGKGSFWNVLCALSYLQKIQKDGANIHLVNASLGGTMAKELFKDSDFLSTIINELCDEMLVIASAGNERTDTDGNGVAALRHYPSSYNAENILAVGGHQESNGELKVHPDSNYGKDSIDLAAPFEGYKIDVNGLPVVDDLKGTSYGTAYVTALAAEFYKNYNGNLSPLEIKSKLLAFAEMEPKLMDNKIAEDRAIIR